MADAFDSVPVVRIRGARRTQDGVSAVLSRCAVFTVRAVFAVHAIGAFWANGTLRTVRAAAGHADQDSTR